MEREIDLKEISDGRLYTAGDMVKIGCNDCFGCSECCRTVEDTIILDPYDIYQLEKVLDVGFEELMKERIALSVVEGIILPHLKIREEGLGCTFLSEEGKCSIHGYRPGFCRMFPMGRLYEEGGFKYFLQVHECTYPNKTKVKLKKWLGIPDLPKYENYIIDWHGFTKKAIEIVKNTENQEIIKKLNLFLLDRFYTSQYRVQEDFYGQFYERLQEAKSVLSMYG